MGGYARDFKRYSAAHRVASQNKSFGMTPSRWCGGQDSLGHRRDAVCIAIVHHLARPCVCQRLPKSCVAHEAGQQEQTGGWAYGYHNLNFAP